MPLLKPFGPDIWLADGGEAEVIGFRYPTRMAVIRLTGGGLFIWSPITLTEGLKRELSALGEVAHIVAPNSLHHLFIAEWVVGYPTASLHAAPGLAGKRPDLDFDGELGARRLRAIDDQRIAVGGLIAEVGDINEITVLECGCRDVGCFEFRVRAAMAAPGDHPLQHLGEVTVEEAFPGYRYGRDMWLNEVRDRAAR